MSTRIMAVLMLLALRASGADVQPAEESEAVKKEQIFQREIAERRRLISQWPTNESPDTNLINFVNSKEGEAMFRAMFETDWIHSSFGLYWDEVPPPTIHGTNAIEGVRRFIAEYGWRMYTDGRSLLLWEALGEGRGPGGHPFRGLPWLCIQQREFRAITDDGILYVGLRYGAPLDCSGVAYNPWTNRFPAIVRRFKHIGEHWYVWREGECPDGPNLYEGEAAPNGQPSASASPSPPVRPETNRTSNPTGSGR